MLTDGLYEEANKSYYIGYSADRSLKTNIAYILHQADMMATHIEFDQWKRGDHLKKVVKQEEVKQKTQQSDDTAQFEDLAWVEMTADKTITCLLYTSDAADE